RFLLTHGMWGAMPVPPRDLHDLINEFIPFNKFLGIKLEEVREGFVRLRLPFRDEFIGDFARPALHGGVISTMIDVAGGFAVWSKILLEDRVSTIDMRVDYLSPGASEDIIAEAEVVRVGNRVGVTDVRVFQPSQP